jgi:group I intron endonuclease
MGWIYLIRNKVNGKCYVGQTRQKKVESRWSQHKNPSSSNMSYLANGIRKYGWDSFEPSIICEILNEKLDAREIIEISERNTIAPNGYNLASGGNLKKITHPATKEKIRQSKLGKFLTEKTKINMSNARIGIVFTSEHRKKMSEALKKNPRVLPIREYNSMMREVSQYSFEGVFIKSYESIKKAGEATGFSACSINNCCRGRRKASNGFNWKYTSTYQINQYTLTGEFIKSFENIKTASKSTGSSERGIGACCNRKSHTSNGFVWKREVKN